MQITREYIGFSKVKYIIEYNDTDEFGSLDYSKCQQTYGVCFYGDKLVIGFGGRKHDWGLIGGTIEKGESFEETLLREIQEESNMKVLLAKPIGYQKVIDTRDNTFIYQLRYACLVEPYGPFVSDPAGGVTEIKLINPADIKKYFDWGEIMDRMLESAVEVLSNIDLQHK